MVWTPLQHMLGGEVFTRISGNLETRACGQAMFLYLEAISLRQGHSSDLGFRSGLKYFPEARSVGQSEAIYTELPYPRTYSSARGWFAVVEVGATR